MRQRVKGPRPPNLARQEDDGIGTAEIAAIAREDTHFFERRVRFEAESLLHPRRLQRTKLKTASAKNSVECFRGCRARSTIAIIKNPAADGFLPRSGDVQAAAAIWRSPLLDFGYFCQFRKIVAKNFHFRETPSSFNALSPIFASRITVGVGKCSNCV